MSDSAEHSPARGRETFSTGRGGMGNMRQASQSRDARPTTGPDDFSITRGRERIPHPNQVFSTGRGGAGNLRSPSRDPRPSPDVEAAEKEVIREYVASQEGAVHSTGRGGIGNMSRSRSRDASIPRYSTGRGGAGNMISGEGTPIEVIDEEERKQYSRPDQVHSTGRGGAANITSAREPPVEYPTHTTTTSVSTGRGGIGNMNRARSSSSSQQRS
ncbi:hypothetical protein CVT26_015505 [Gymnopilus dilepis]|uniref:Uncharacterized protein n=1 Tax=Gymnopilus dilepis TaxID=231916 RepID=A0A409WA38_9AGAR|nr:hypothetical protein CVT26_015505 [Gymnopilus dilepis]